MHTRLRPLAVLLAALLLLPIGTALAAPGLCNGQGAFGPVGYSVTVAPSGTSAPVGVGHTITATVLDRGGSPVVGFCLDFIQNAGPSGGWPRSATTDKAGKASVTWSSSAVGTDSITGYYTDDTGARVGGTIRHSWTPKPTPSPPPTGTPTPTPSPTASPTPSPTVSPTASPTPSPTPSPTVSPTASPTMSPTPSPTASPTPSAPPTVGTFGDGSIELDHPSALPGGTVTVTGRNCPAGSEVSFTIEGTPGGTAKAAPDGTFEDAVQLPDTTLGRHVVDVSCGGRRASVPIDLVVSSSTSSPASGATVLAVLVFFVLLGSVLFTRGAARRKPVS